MTRSSFPLLGSLLISTNYLEAFGAYKNHNSIHGLSHSTDEWKLSAISTAAPPRIAKHAHVKDSNDKVLQHGTNGWTCFPTIPEPAEGYENPLAAVPVCADSVGLQWFGAFLKGEKINTDRDAIIYMLHGDLGTDNRKPGVSDPKLAGEHWIASGPHIMVMPKDPSTMDQYPTDFKSGGAYAMWQGTDYAHLMIPMEVMPKANDAIDHQSDEWLIQALESTAPVDVGRHATLLRGDMSVLRAGTNDWTCLAAAPEPVNGYVSAQSMVPLCVDDVGMAWVSGYMSNTSPKMERDAIIYMMNGDGGEDNTRPYITDKDEAGENWIVSGPHIMVMPKNASDMNNWPSDFTLGTPFAMFKETKFAHVMIPME